MSLNSIDKTSGNDSRLVSLREAARLLGVHHSTLSRAVKRGTLPVTSTTPQGWNRFRISDIQKLRNGASGGPNPYPGQTRLKRNARRLDRLLKSIQAQLNSTSSLDPVSMKNAMEQVKDQLERAVKIAGLIDDQVGGTTGEPQRDR